MNYLIQILAPHPSNEDADVVVDSQFFSNWDNAVDWAAQSGDVDCSVDYFKRSGDGLSWSRMGKVDFDAIAREYEEA